jgi:hypothetical protein
MLYWIGSGDDSKYVLNRIKFISEPSKITDDYVVGEFTDGFVKINGIIYELTRICRYTFFTKRLIKSLENIIPNGVQTIVLHDFRSEKKMEIFTHQQNIFSSITI